MNRHGVTKRPPSVFAAPTEAAPARILSKADWIDLYADLYRQCFGETESTDPIIMADVLDRAAILRLPNARAAQRAHRAATAPPADATEDAKPDPARDLARAMLALVAAAQPHTDAYTRIPADAYTRLCDTASAARAARVPLGQLAPFFIHEAAPLATGDPTSPDVIYPRARFAELAAHLARNRSIAELATGSHPTQRRQATN